MSVSLEKKTMLEAFRQKMAPSSFLSSWFRTTERDIFRSKKAVIDVKRDNEKIAIDVTRATEGTRNVRKQFTTKEYIPPMFNEYHAYDADELNDRMPGSTEYDNPDYMAQAIAIMTDDQVTSQEKIVRAIEKMAADVLTTGAIVLINGDTIDFKQKSTHDFNAATDWDETATAKPWVELEKCSNLNRKDGKVGGGEDQVVICGANALKWLMEATKMENRLNLRRADLASLINPIMNSNGATFHGILSAGSYKFQLWGYPQFYDLPTDAELGLPSGTITNAGTTQPYIPTDRVVVIPQAGMIDLRLVFAGIPTLVSRVDPRMAALGLTAMPANIRTDWHPYALVDQKADTVQVGVKSAPLPIPTQIDGWCTFDAKAT